MRRHPTRSEKRVDPPEKPTSRRSPQRGFADSQSWKEVLLESEIGDPASAKATDKLLPASGSNRMQKP
jgi:hypothetical protein